MPDTKLSQHAQKHQTKEKEYHNISKTIIELKPAAWLEDAQSKALLVLLEWKKPILEKEKLSNQLFRISENYFKHKSFRLFYLFLTLIILPLQKPLTRV